MNLDTVRWVKEQSQDYLLGRQNVVACGIGFKETAGEVTDKPCVVVSVTRKLREAQLVHSEIVPKRLGEVATDIQETGVIRALYIPLQGPKDRWRPAPGGVSIGHIDVTAGTLGCLVKRNGWLYILSNNHVLANSNAARDGDPIIQPGRYDGGGSDDQIATLGEFIPINFGSSTSTCSIARGMEKLLNRLAKALGSKHRMASFRETPGANRVDAAIARPLCDNQVDKLILHIGVPKGSRRAGLGTRIKKSGRTTGLTSGVITQVDVTAKVDYGLGRMAIFEDQLMAGAMSQGGDSGSVVLDEDDFVIGLLFAGSDAVTIMNPIHFVLDALRVAIVV